MWDVIESILKGLFRLLFHVLVDMLFEVLFLGPGFLIVSRFGSRKDIELYGWDVLLISIVFWGIVALGISHILGY